MRRLTGTTDTSNFTSPLSNPTSKRATIGIKTHSGWAALVAVEGTFPTPKVLVRQRLDLIETDDGANQPYHYAKQLKLAEAKEYLDRTATTSRRLAKNALQQVAARIHEQNYALVGCGILLASGRPLPKLEEILASHPLMHAAEGEFFRTAIRDACRELNIPNTGVRERGIFEQSASKFKVEVSALKAQLTILGRSLGSPWTKDQKQASMAALLVLARPT